MGMMKRGVFRCLLYLGATAVGLAVLLCGIGWLARPDMSGRPPEADPEAVRKVNEARQVRLDADHPPALCREVNYAEGPSAAWYPKGEAPILAKLVAGGKLPPVAERVGREPCVVEGVEGIGTYGGTWYRVASTESDAAGVLNTRMAYATLVRWSPQGYPIVPHVARSYEVSPDSREFTFHLRRGMRWSDGRPFTADDILYWWKYEANDRRLSGPIPNIMKVGPDPGNVEKVDDYTVKFTFPRPNGLFVAKLATAQGAGVIGSPEHYLRPYHPTLGDPDLIRRTQAARRIQSPESLYRALKDTYNPEHPRLWPWVYRTYKPSPPQAFIRNAYYFMVDTKGNQLPYVDRVHFEVKSMGMIAVSAKDGEITMQERHLYYDQYTLLMSMREQSGYEVLHWYPGDASVFVISVNLNRREDDAPDSARKKELLNDKRFRQALSLAIRRRDIIEAESNGQGEPAQCAPGPQSYFYEPTLYKSFTDYDPDRANRLLDDVGLTTRDYEGYRTFRDGTRMTFYLNMSQGYGTTTPGQFIVDDWEKVGIRAIPRERARTLFYTEKAALEHDFNVWIGNGEFMPLIEPRYLVPAGGESNYAPAFAKWFIRGGLYGDPLSKGAGCVEPPPGHPLRRAMEVYEAACAVSGRQEQREIFREALRIAAENVWTINISTPPPALVIVKNGFRNVPRCAVSSWDFQSPGNTGVETYFFEKPGDSPGAIAEIQEAVLKVTPAPDALASVEKQATLGDRVGAAVTYLLAAIAVLAAVLVSVRHPYIGRRLLIMVPTLLVISLIAFTVIQLPPGDFLTSRIMQLQEQGDTADLQQIEELKSMFYLDESMPVRYARWLGLVWFATFDSKDAGLLQGNMGRSMENSRIVNDIVGDRILLTILVSLGAILLTWVIAIPVGIYSAARQYSIGDYAVTLIGFIGMCVPAFLLALVLMFLADKYLGVKVSGLFSPEFGAQPEWTWPKVVDLLKHIWLPVVVLGVGGTAGMIRVMRGNLLDELKKPYVTTARAKGVRPLPLLFKYPVRLALNPFVSGIGGLFPELVSGGAIVAMVLSLPMVGPLMLSALMTEDMYLAGSMLMVLSLLSVMGTLVSDLLLLWLDPRIRFKGGTR